MFRHAVFLTVALGFAGAGLTAAPAVAAKLEDPPNLQCDRGPAERYFASVQWYVYACDDGASVVVITGPKSPKDLEFYFILFPKDGAYQLVGEGNGDKALTRSAYEVLSVMTPDEIAALYDEADAIEQVTDPGS